MGNVVLEMVLDEALSELDQSVTAETSAETLTILDKIENHALLKDNNAFIITKKNDRIILVATKNYNLKFKGAKPMNVDIQDILNTIREKAEKRK